LVTASGDRAVLWDLASGRELRSFQGHGGFITSGALSSDGQWLVTGGQDRSARLWEVSSGKEVRRFQPPDPYSRGTSVALSRDGKWLVTVGGGSLRLWEVSSGDHVRSFRGHTNDITSMTLSGDGKWLATSEHHN